MVKRLETEGKKLSDRDEELEANRACIMSLESDLADVLRKMTDAECPLRHLEIYVGLKDERITSLDKLVEEMNASEGKGATDDDEEEEVVLRKIAGAGNIRMQQKKRETTVDDVRDDMEVATGDDVIAVLSE
mmetsp:Transcript_27156/g.57664  ORF Transcript_27156/g.57664 Transcript_27156/m.57664 type:complete len:132 (+) Transcript_27156:880-1275(+)